jgi:hypothetical protein
MNKSDSFITIKKQIYTDEKAFIDYPFAFTSEGGNGTVAARNWWAANA